MIDALVIAPHPDDAELGMGGTIGVMLSQGMSVGILDLTDGEPTPRGSVELRARETAAALATKSAERGFNWVCKTVMSSSFASELRAYSPMLSVRRVANPATMPLKYG